MQIKSTFVLFIVALAMLFPADAAGAKLNRNREQTTIQHPKPTFTPTPAELVVQAVPTSAPAVAAPPVPYRRPLAPRSSSAIRWSMCALAPVSTSRS
ncbi:MAG: hypothetical protein R3A10_00535 [Caldilineaceae bacterium]